MPSKKPIARAVNRPPRKTQYPFRSLNVGDSFFVHGREKEAYLRTQASRLGKSIGAFYTVSRESRRKKGKDILGIFIYRFQ